ncbi:MAG: hypothetical protein ACI8ZB_000990 [Desulforhopalus sp.]|jgi:hypothetical protein
MSNAKTDCLHINECKAMCFLCLPPCGITNFAESASLTATWCTQVRLRVCCLPSSAYLAIAIFRFYVAIVIGKKLLSLKWFKVTPLLTFFKGLIIIAAGVIFIPDIIAGYFLTQTFKISKHHHDTSWA